MVIFFRTDAVYGGSSGIVGKDLKSTVSMAMLGTMSMGLTLSMEYVYKKVEKRKLCYNIRKQEQKDGRKHMLERLRFWLEDHVSGRMALVGLLVLVIFFFWLGSQYQIWQQRHQPLLVSGQGEDDRLMLVNDRPTMQEKESAASKEMVVHVAGAVDRPGVYRLKSDSRIQDALEMAGLSADADPNQLNLAQMIHDGEKIMVPRQGEAESLGVSSAGAADVSSSGQSGKISINQASLNELMTLPSIGEVRAQAIIAYRQEHGGFKSLEELKNVSGIGDKTYAQLESLVRL